MKKISQHGVTITITRSEVDKTPIVYIDTDGEGEVEGQPRARIYLNESCMYEVPKYPVVVREY